MRYDPKKHHRRSIRLKGYGYSQAGAYFVTICTHNRELWLENDAYRKILQRIWNELTNHYPQIRLDEFVIMPNHVYGIIWIIGGAIHESPLHRSRSLLSKIIGYFKMNTAKQINILRATPGIPLWQRNYYEHIIRTEDELNRIREYIRNNPLQWELDRENPNRTDIDEFDQWLYGG